MRFLMNFSAPRPQRVVETQYTRRTGARLANGGYADSFPRSKSAVADFDRFNCLAETRVYAGSAGGGMEREAPHLPQHTPDPFPEGAREQPAATSKLSLAPMSTTRTWINLVRGREGHGRSFMKAVSWRAVGTIDTFIISFFVTGKVSLAGSIAAVEVVTKIVIYYLHERVWAVLPWGHRQNQPGSRVQGERNPGTALPQG